MLSRKLVVFLAFVIRFALIIIKNKSLNGGK